MYTKHVSPRGGGAFAHPCPCGIEVVSPLQDKMLEMFDGWYGDKAYREHEYVVQWCDTISTMLMDNINKTMSFRFEDKKVEEEHEEGHRHGDARGGAADDGSFVSGPSEL